ncbi:MAG: hypothetical protein KJ011_15640 [Burkholderiaceae bacterium]|nr:hypothetical protein [Burkholderiaceae bacterium]
MFPLSAMHRYRATPVTAACVLALTACAPDHDWREIRQPTEGYLVMLPARPASMSRAIDLDGLPVTMAMTGARVGEQSFTVGAVVLPDGDAATRTKAGAAMRTAMVRNIAGRETAAIEVQVPVLAAAGRAATTQSALRIEAAGRVADRPAHMSAQFVARGNRAWQVVMIGPQADPDSAQQFLDSFRVVE